MTDAADNVIPPEFSFLREECGFRDDFHGRDYIELVGGNLRIKFGRDRYGPIVIMVASIHDQQGPGNWIVDFALHQVMCLALKADPDKFPSNAEMADFLRTNMSMVQSMFSSSNLKETKAASDRLTAEWLRKSEKAADRARRGRRLT